MKTLSIARLEDARNNTLDIAQELIDNKAGAGFTETAEKHLINAIRQYQRDQNLEKALRDYDSNTANAPAASAMAKRKSQVREYLKPFASLWEANGFIRIGPERNIRYFINEELLLTGNMPALLKDKQGKLVTLFLSRNANKTWDRQLKFPFIQKLLQINLVDIPNAGFEVGIFTLEDCNLATRTYTEAEINSTLSEIATIGTKITDYINLQKASAIRADAIKGSMSLAFKQNQRI